MPEVSVIVPVYKVERYLPQCIESLLAQTFRDIEIILVDDGSPDNSGAICDEYAERDERIVVLHKENGGVSSARNMGLDHARGKYIMFCDSDDIVDMRWAEQLHKSVSCENIELAVCGFEVRARKSDQKRFEIYVSREKEKHEQAYWWQLYQDGLFHSLWNKIYRIEIIKDNNLSFDKDVSCSEDLLFNLSYMRNCEGLISLIPFCLYHYYKEVEESLTCRYHENYWEVKKRCMTEIKQLMHLNHLKNEKEYYTAYITAIISALNVLIRDGALQDLSKRTQKGREILNSEECKKAFSKGDFIDVHPLYIGILKMRSFLLVYLFHAAVKFKHLIFKD